MRVLLPILVVLTGCGTGSRLPGPQPQAKPTVGLTDAAALPVVMFRLLIIRDWESPYFIIESQDLDLTLPAALELGIPAELWIRCAIENPKGFRQEIYWVRKLRA
jgi:hypothetical protein